MNERRLIVEAVSVEAAVECDAPAGACHPIGAEGAPPVAETVCMFSGGEWWDAVVVVRETTRLGQVFDDSAIIDEPGSRRRAAAATARRRSVEEASASSGLPQDAATTPMHGAEARRRMGIRGGGECRNEEVLALLAGAATLAINGGQFASPVQAAQKVYVVLAKAGSGNELPLEVLYSANGFYIGTSEDNLPNSRESVEYWARRELAVRALENDAWTQRLHP